VPLLRLLDSRNGSLQHNAAFALYGLADNEVVFILRLQGFNIGPTRSVMVFNAYLVVMLTVRLNLRL